MSRIASMPLQNSLASSMLRRQEAIADSNAQLASGKKAVDHKGLGVDAVRVLSARAALSRTEAYRASTERVDVTMSLYDANLSGIETSATALQQSVLAALGTGQTAGLQEAAEAAFSRVRAALNASEGGIPLFAGSRTDTSPFTRTKLADMAGASVAGAFANDGVRAAAELAEGRSIAYGIGADEVATGVMAAFKTIAEAGPIGATLTAAQAAALEQAIGELNTGIEQVRTVNAENGRKQAEVETLTVRAEERKLLLDTLVSRSEDADPIQLAIDLSLQETALNTSYLAYSKLSSLSLLNYMR